MLFTEQVRTLADEEELVNDTSNHDSPTNTLHDWTTRETKNITLATAAIVYVKWTTSNTPSGASQAGASRVLLDGVPICSTGGIPAPDSVTREIYLILAAGSYALAFQSAAWDVSAGHYVRITNIIIGTLNFSDRNTSYLYYAGNALIEDDANSDLIDEDIVVPSRTLAIGAINKVTVYITAICYAAGNRENEMLNDGDSTTAGKSGFKIEVDSVQKDWHTRKNDDADGSAAELTFGEGSYGRLVYVADAGATINIKINAENKTGSTKTHYAYIRIVMCPWIIPDETYEPVTLDISPGSTIYFMLEPLDANPTKTVKLGRKRFVSFGEATDYYNTDSGTGLLDYNYTFENVRAAGVQVLFSGFGGCISHVGVDLM